MSTKLLKIAVLGILVSMPVLAAGCTSDNSTKPYSVTGEPTVASRPDWQNPKYQDSKGRYRPDLYRNNGQ